ncbi:hypothetical protein PVK06_002575 [Gossypium arboreum]|uniref:RNase H type-1 domain-containing protein n=1 Tax=Gossypium arboreum TaxID=29729 RepID=A0ABR0R583_GOSAR|nr:hypothetical protein PVK06_002575 [Gossypium arboreum]
MLIYCFVFQDNAWSTKDIIRTSYSWARQYVIASKSPLQKSHPFVTTSPLVRDSVCLNTDELVRVKGDFASAGGLVRDSNRAWMFGFCRYFGCCSVLDDELWAILDGLHLTLDRGFNHILIQIDSRKAILVIQEEPVGGHKSTLIRRIQQLLIQEHHWCIQHDPSKENKNGDALAKMVHDKILDVRFLNNPY